MREIKFRAWVVEEFEEDGNTPKTFKMHEWNPYFFSDSSAVTSYGDEFPDPDDPCVILMQYTGLKDKNGKEIYESDIVNIDYGNTIVRAEVEYCICGFRGTTDSDAWELDGYVNIEIIGNIYENPELLEGRQDACSDGKKS
jgi:uncharacterized phage protein (TIGR01671 family)